MTHIEIYMEISKDDLRDAGFKAELEGNRLKAFMAYTGALFELDVDEHGLVHIKTVNGVEVVHPSRSVEE